MSRPQNDQNAPVAASGLQTTNGQPAKDDQPRLTGPAPQPKQTIPGTRPAYAAVHSLDLPDQQRLDETTMDPERHYRWVALDRVSRRKLQGYEVEMDRKGGPKPLAQGEQAGDGTIRSGDLILMSCPKEMRDARQSRILKLNQQKLDSATATTKQMAEQKGVKLLDDSRENIERTED